MITAAFCLAALLVGLLMPTRWNALGFVLAGAVLFLLQGAVRVSMGFAGANIEESLLLFNGSWVSYVGFNLQITYRAFAPVLLALAVPFIIRLKRHS